MPKKKPTVSRTAIGFLVTLILVQFLLFIVAMFSLVLPPMSAFFFVNSVPTLAFWILLAVAVGLVIAAGYLGYRRSVAAYFAAIIAGILFGLLFSVALMSVTLF